jgi:hypothetical protein
MTYLLCKLFLVVDFLLILVEVARFCYATSTKINKKLTGRVNRS